MKTTALFSISTKDFVSKAKVSLDSFVSNCSYKIDMHNIVLEEIQNEIYNNENIKRFFYRYKNDLNTLRWSLKPGLLLYFLEDKKYDNAIYIDNDVYFVNNNDFLIDDLDKGILLTKHSRPLYPNVNQFLNSQFLCNFTDGFFNAGFIGASNIGVPGIKWWSEMNYWQCCKSYQYGLYDDQKYLDILALEFNNLVRICNHPGCNLATWNSQTIKRCFKNNKWKINDNYNPIFCHFSSMSGVNDPMLLYYYNEYSTKI